MWRRYSADASTGEIVGTSAGAPHGRIGAVRFAPPYDSHDFADDTSRIGPPAPAGRPPLPRGREPHRTLRAASPRQFADDVRRPVGRGPGQAKAAGWKVE